MQVSVLVCNFEELKEVKKLAQHLLDSNTPIHMLFNIAGRAKSCRCSIIGAAGGRNWQGLNPYPINEDGPRLSEEQKVTSNLLRLAAHLMIGRVELVVHLIKL